MKLVFLRGRRGFTRQPENSKRAHFRPPALQTPPKFHGTTPKRGRKNENCLRGPTLRVFVLPCFVFILLFFFFDKGQKTETPILAEVGFAMCPARPLMMPRSCTATSVLTHVVRLSQCCQARVGGRGGSHDVLRQHISRHMLLEAALTDGLLRNSCCVRHQETGRKQRDSGQHRPSESRAVRSSASP